VRCGGKRERAEKSSFFCLQNDKFRSGIVFTHWSKNGFFAPQGRHVAPIKVKFGTMCQISPLSGQKCGNTAPKMSKCRILAINLPLRGDSFAQF